MTLGKRLKRLRGKRTQREIAVALGISRARYSHYENDHVQPDHELLQKMASLYGETIDFLIGGIKTKNVKESEYTLSESEFERIVREIEDEEGIILHGNPIAHQAVRDALNIIIRTTKAFDKK